jgi:hypothetical protein
MVEASVDYDLIRLIGYILEPLAKVRALLQGQTFIHSSAVAIESRGVLLCAWGNTGKTNLMLKLAESGGTMLSDDWSLLMADGTIAGYPRPVNLMNYNLDIFPRLRRQLSWKKKLVYFCDRSFRRFRRRFPRSNPAMLRAGDMVERLLELGANARLPLGRFETLRGTSLPAAAIIELHKVRTGAITEFSSLTIDHAVRSATVCFAFENTRLIQRLAEHAYVFPESDNLPARILDLYAATLRLNMVRSAGVRIWSIGIPSQPSMAELDSLAARIQTLVSHGP